MATGGNSKPLPSFRERLLSRLVMDPSGCLLWTGGQDGYGYGRISVNGRPQKVHRVVWELWVGPIPPGMTLDHVRAWGCTHKNCASIAHLEPVTPQENTRRAAPTHCVNGHPFDLLNTYVRPSGYRDCRICKVASLLRYDKTHRAERTASRRALRARKRAAA